MKSQTSIFILLFATLLTGCGVKKEDHQQVLTELEETKQAHQQVLTELEETKQAHQQVLTELEETKQALEQSQSEVDRLKEQDGYVFSQAGKLFDSGDMSGSLRAYQGFVRDFPDSPRVSAANSQIQIINERLRSQQRAEAARAERERQESARIELQRKLRSGELTLIEWSQILDGKSMQEVINLIGRPNSNLSDNQMWGYNDMVYDPILDRKRKLQVNFYRSGQFRGVKYW